MESNAERPSVNLKERLQPLPKGDKAEDLAQLGVSGDYNTNDLRISFRHIYRETRYHVFRDSIHT